MKLKCLANCVLTLQYVNVINDQVNFVKEYWNEVFSPMLAGYRSGAVTPNPDVYCNRQVKFHHMKRFIEDKLGIQTMATGHYARTRVLPGEEVLPQLLKGVDPAKDQSYFLSLVKVLCVHVAVHRDMTVTTLLRTVVTRASSCVMFCSPLVNTRRHRYGAWWPSGSRACRC